MVIEGVGEAVTGGLAARAVEPAAGEGQGAKGGQCLNCGTALVGDYCHACGQSGHVHRTFTAWWHDLSHGVLHLDGKVWRTLPLLFFRPGQITRRYIDGERAKFVSPMAAFLFSVFAMFAIFSATGGPFDFSPPGVTNAQTEIAAERDAVRAQIAELEKKRIEEVAAGRSTTAIDEDLRAARVGLQVMNGMTGVPVDPDAVPDDVNFNTGWAPLDQAARKAGANPSLLFYKIQTNGYKFSWALIPISVPFVWLLFLWRRGFRVYDHAVFVTYSIAFMSLLLILLSLLRPVGVPQGAIWTVAVFAPPIHMYKQLRGTYRLSRFSAIWRLSLLLIFAVIAATLFALLLVALGALA